VVLKKREINSAVKVRSEKREARHIVVLGDKAINIQT